MRRPSLTTTVPLPRDSPILRRDTTSYEPSSRIVSSMYSGSDPDPYSTPCQVPATDPMLDTVTGVIGPKLAQPTSEMANSTRTATARVAQGDRAPLDVIAFSYYSGVTRSSSSQDAVGRDSSPRALGTRRCSALGAVALPSWRSRRTPRAPGPRRGSSAPLRPIQYQPGDLASCCRSRRCPPGPPRYPRASAF